MKLDTPIKINYLKINRLKCTQKARATPSKYLTLVSEFSISKNGKFNDLQINNPIKWTAFLTIAGKKPAIRNAFLAKSNTDTRSVSPLVATLAYGPSMANAPEAIPNRLARKEPADVVIMVGYALDKLIAEGKVMPGSRVELADSRIGMVVRAGEPKPDIGSVEAFKETLLDAKSVAYSDSASGVYIGNELFEKMGIEAQMKPKATMIPKIPVGSVVAKGDYQLGFQQVSELLPGPVPSSSARFRSRCSRSRVTQPVSRWAQPIHAKPGSFSTFSPRPRPRPTSPAPASIRSPHTSVEATTA